MENNRCILCGKPEELMCRDVKDFEYNIPGMFQFFGCKECQILSIHPFPSLEFLKNSYPEDYHGFYTLSNSIVGLLYRIVNRFRFNLYARLMNNAGAALDVGCADGSYFDEFIKHCPQCEIEGVEFIDEIAQKGRSRNRRIYTGTIFDLDVAKKYDLIIMNNLIEHVVDPFALLNKAKELLAPRGKIIIETPNIDSWDFGVFRKYWGGLHVPRHTYLFSTRSLFLLLKKAKLEVLQTDYLINTDHWALSVQNYLERNNNCKYLFRGRVFYYKYLLFLFIPINLIQKIFSKTGSFAVIAANDNEI